MIHHSPLPDVEIPDLPLTEYVLAGGAGRADAPALIDGMSGRVMTYGELESAIRSLAGGLAAAGSGWGRAGPDGAERAGVRRGVPRDRDGRQDCHDDQPDLHPGRGAPSAGGLRRPDPRDHRAAGRDGHPRLQGNRVTGIYLLG